MKRFHLNLNLKSVIILIAVGVLLPVLLSTAVGIVSIVWAKDVPGIVLGVLVISFAVAAMGSALVTVVLTGRKAWLARRQADFVANVSHEFRTPLSAIKLYAQTLQSGKLADDPERTAQCIATILREAEWLDVLVERVLTWRASSKDMLPLEMVTRPVSQSVSDAVERFRSMVDPEGLVLEAAVDSTLCVLHDEGAINAVVLNLLTNAYKYTADEKQISLSVCDVNDHVVIEVRDNGVGLSPIEAKRVFQPFYRSERSDGARASGMGLGLAIARYLVSLHKGKIEVSSKEGEGSTFIIQLPAVEDES